MRYAVGTELGSYFNGFNRYVIEGSNPVTQWSRNHAVIFDCKEDAEGFIKKYGRSSNLHLVEMIPIAPK